ncbi:MAG: Rne/Rng family ribonuclease [Actinobacteria bacterium]|nr:Rne/Rng family ribonuclease [Actinomycetota bacterium]
MGDSRPAGESDAGSDNDSPRDDVSNDGRTESDSGANAEGANRKRRRGGRGRGRGKVANEGQNQSAQNGRRDQNQTSGQQNGQRKGKGRNNAGGGQRQPVTPVEANLIDERPVQLDDAALEKRRGQEHKGRPVGRYQMVVHVEGEVTHIAVLEGRTLIEHYVSRPADDVSQIHGNIYLGRVQNVLPGMEAAFIDIGTPKNAVLYRGDVSFDRDDVDSGDGKPSQPKGRKSRHRNNGGPRIEQLLKARQTIVCQVTKNPISHKGARLTTEVSLPGRFVVLVPNSSTYGISKRLSDKERRRLRRILDKVKPKGHGLIVRTAAEDVTAEEIERDVARLHQQWQGIEKLANSAKTPSILFREPDMAVRVIREEFTKEYRGVIIDDRALYEQVKSYMETITPALADRIEYHDRSKESLSVFERFHVGEQFRKAVDRKVWLPSGGSLIIEHTEALTVIDVNTGKNVGSTNLEATVFSNNLEAADEIAKQLRLRDIGGIIVIDFVDMEIKANREEVMRVFRDALARDKTRTQAFDITDLGLVEMTRKRIGEGLLESVSCRCADCDGRGIRFLPEAIPE